MVIAREVKVMKKEKRRKGGRGCGTRVGANEKIWAGSSCRCTTSLARSVTLHVYMQCASLARADFVDQTKFDNQSKCKYIVIAEFKT